MARGWLKAAAGPGQRQLRAAAACQVLAAVFTVVQWAGLAWAAQDVLTGGRPARVWPARIWLALGVLLAGGLLAAAASWAAARYAAAGRQRISGAIRQRLVAGLLPDGQRRGDPDPAIAALAAVELADDVAGYHAQSVPLHLSAPVSMLAVFAVTAAVQWPAAVILLAGSLIVPPNMRLAGLFAAEGTGEQVAASTRLSAVVLDSFRGMRTLAAIGAVGRRREDLAAAAAGLNTATMATVRRAFLSGAVMDMVITFAIAVDATYIGLSLLGYVHLAAAPRMTLFSGLLALLLCPMYFAPLRTVAATYHTRERAAAAAPVITGLLAGTPPAPDPPASPGPAPAPAASEPETVWLDGVTFCFPGTGRPVLANVTLTARPGEWVAITGPSGAGKTTLLSLAAGMRQPSGGTVRWETRAGTVPPHLGGCAWIGQQTVILLGTIGDNIRIGRPAAPQVDIESAVAAAGLADVVARLPDGLDTPLGEGGWGLSTGEARRIAIARAFLRDAGLWLLDEPTAHLDPAAEARVIDALRAATRGRTVIVATHSAALARAAGTVFTITGRTVQPAREVIPA
jgi:ATP-binding cassette subfamily C protein CydD